jgi:predicted SprT family Zn-dependent metalloprotease
MDELFDELNREHFDGGLQRPKFAVDKLGHYAFYAPHVEIIFMHPRTLDQERKFVADTLLHELLHYALEVRTEDHAQDHGAAFVGLANEIGARLGLPAVQVGTDAVVEWPQSVRPVAYSPWHACSR